MEVYVDDDSKLTLHGLQQHYVKLKDNEKNRKLFDLLDALEFNQVMHVLSFVPGFSGSQPHISVFSHDIAFFPKPNSQAV